MTMANVLCLLEKEVGRYLEDLAHKAHKAKGQGEGDGVSPIVGDRPRVQCVWNF